MNIDFVKNSRFWLIFIQGVIAFGAFAGGSMLLLSPEGSPGLQLDKVVLEDSPFTNFLVPAIILISVIGVGHVLGVILSLMEYRKAALYGLLMGITLFTWLTIQIVLIGFHFLQPIHYAMGVVELISAYKLRKSNSFD